MGGSGSQKVFAAVKSYSKRGQLLTRQDFQSLAEARDLDEMVTRLRSASAEYAAALADVPKPYTAQGIEAALRGRLAEVHHSISKASGGSKVLRAYYMKFPIWNLKLILKGKILGKAQDEIEPLLNLRAEELIKQRDIVLKALVSKDLEEAVSGLAATAYGAEVARAAALYAERGNMQVFDTYFDKVWVEQLSSGLRTSGERDMAKLVGMTIDFYNLMSVLRGKFWGLDEQAINDLVVAPTASAPRELLDSMLSAATVRDALGELAGAPSSPYREMASVQADSEMDAVSAFERAFEAAVHARARASFTRMFSPATSVGITILTAFEVRNLASVAFAVEQGIPPQEAVPKLVLEE